MHIFLTGPRRVGKSTVIQKTISLLQEEGELCLGGFLTYWGVEGDPHLYITAADPGRRQAPARLADYQNGGLIRHAEAFEQQGVELLRLVERLQLICMDELGFLEADSPLFQQQVYCLLDGDTPVLGVLRAGDIPWHEPIKAHPRVRLCEVNLENREQLPVQLAALLRLRIRH